MTDNSPLSNNPANNQSLDGVLRFREAKFANRLNNMLPALVIAYDRPSNRAQVQPLISRITTKGTILIRARVASVPVLQLGGGGFVMSFNVQAGNLGWLKANDQDISLFKQTYEQSPPNTKRKHNFSDAMFIPDVMTGYTIAEEDAGNAVLQSLDGSVRIALWPDKVKITSPKVAIGDTPGFTPNVGAFLDLQSTHGALQVPRMTHAQRDAIPSPQGGFIVYVTDAPTGFSLYTDGTGWS